MTTATLRLPRARGAVRVHPRSLGVGAALALVAFALLVASVSLGEFSIPPDQVVATLFGGGDRSTQFVINTLRLPRALDALLVGAAFGVAGGVFQSLTRNPLGSPDVIGFAAGSSAAAVFQILVIGGGTFAVAGGSIVGGLLTSAIVYGLAYRNGSVQGYRLILVGIGMSLALYALVDYLVTRARLEDAALANVWLVGSLNGRGWEHVQPLALALVVLAPFVVLLARPLRMMEMGDDTAKALGVSVERSRLGLIVVGTLLTAAATASAGPIPFVALAAPQIGRRLTGAAGPGLGTAALTGSVLLLGSDFAVQRVFPSGALPVGVMTGLIGGVYLIWLLSREWRSR